MEKKFNFLSKTLTTYFSPTPRVCFLYLSHPKRHTVKLKGHFLLSLEHCLSRVVERILLGTFFFNELKFPGWARISFKRFCIHAQFNSGRISRSTLNKAFTCTGSAWRRQSRRDLILNFSTAGALSSRDFLLALIWDLRKRKKNKDLVCPQPPLAFR